MKAWSIGGLLLCVLTILGCQHLRPDKVENAIKSGFLTAEFTACGETSQSVGHCFVAPKTPLSQLGFSVQGVFSGTVTFNGCGLNESVVYSSWQDVKPLSDPSIESPCIIAATVSPRLPAQGNSAVEVGSFRMVLYVLFQSPEVPTVFQWDQISENESVLPKFELFLNGETAADVRFTSVGTGCGVRPDTRHYEAPDGTLQIPLADFKLNQIKSQCVLTGVVDTPSERLSVMWFVNSYSKTFIPLPIPQMWWKSTSQLCIQADENASIVMVDYRYKLSNEHCFKKVYESEDHVIRIITVGGRLQVGHWDAQAGLWHWKGGP